MISKDDIKFDIGDSIYTISIGSDYLSKDDKNERFLRKHVQILKVTIKGIYVGTDEKKDIVYYPENTRDVEEVPQELAFKTYSECAKFVKEKIYKL